METEDREPSRWLMPSLWVLDSPCRLQSWPGSGSGSWSRRTEATDDGGALRRAPRSCSRRSRGPCQRAS